MRFDGKEIGGRETGPAIINLEGETDIAEQYIDIARTELGKLKERMQKTRINYDKYQKVLSKKPLVAIQVSSNMAGLSDIDRISILALKELGDFIFKIAGYIVHCYVPDDIDSENPLYDGHLETKEKKNKKFLTGIKAITNMDYEQLIDEEYLEPGEIKKTRDSTMYVRGNELFPLEDKHPISFFPGNMNIKVDRFWDVGGNTSVSQAYAGPSITGGSAAALLADQTTRHNDNYDEIMLWGTPDGDPTKAPIVQYEIDKGYSPTACQRDKELHVSISGVKPKSILSVSKIELTHSKFDCIAVVMPWDFSYEFKDHDYYIKRDTIDSHQDNDWTSNVVGYFSQEGAFLTTYTNEQTIGDLIAQYEGFLGWTNLYITAWVPVSIFYRDDEEEIPKFNDFKADAKVKPGEYFVKGAGIFRISYLLERTYSSGVSEYFMYPDVKHILEYDPASKDFQTEKIVIQIGKEFTHLSEVVKVESLTAQELKDQENV